MIKHKVWLDTHIPSLYCRILDGSCETLSLMSRHMFTAMCGEMVLVASKYHRGPQLPPDVSCKAI